MTTPDETDQCSPEAKGEDLQHGDRLKLLENIRMQTVINNPPLIATPAYSFSASQCIWKYVGQLLCSPVK